MNLSTTHVSVIERGLKVTKLDTFVAIVNALDVSAYPDPVLVDKEAEANWGISLDDLKNIANGNLAKHPIPMQPFITLNGTWIYVLDTAQDAIPSYLSSCIFQSSFQYSVYEALNKSLTISGDMGYSSGIQFQVR